METLVAILAGILAPLSVGLLLTCIVAGLFFGIFYNYRLQLGEQIIFHKLVAGLGFIGFVFFYRLMTAVLTASVVPNPAGWIGIGLIWATFCLFIYVGSKGTSKLVNELNRRNLRK